MSTLEKLLLPFGFALLPVALAICAGVWLAAVIVGPFTATRLN